VTHREDDTGVGVPEAVGMTLRMLERELGADAMDRLWIFPPLVRGRRERGLVAVSCYPEVEAEAEAAEAEVATDDEGGMDAEGEAELEARGALRRRFLTAADRRRLHTAAYTAERTGTGLDFEPSLREEGSAPQDRLPRIIDGVVRRSGLDSGSPREVRVGGDPAVFAALLSELELPEASPT
jgi:hypothetical protein